MISNFWYVISQSSKIKKKPLALRRFSKDLVLWRNNDNKIICLEDRCPHRRTKLSAGKIIDEEIQCPYHGFRFAENGKCSLIPAHGKEHPSSRVYSVQKYHIHEEDSLVWFWFGEGEPTKEIPKFEELDQSTYAFVDVDKIAPIGFGRLMESTMDYAHFPFVHANYISAEVKQVFAKTFNVKTSNLRIDMDCIFSTDPKEKGKYSQTKLIGSTIFPNVSMYGAYLGKTPNLSVAYVCPVDENNAWFTLRIFLKKGPLEWIKTKLMKHLILDLIWNYWVYPQDLKMWIGQDPKNTGLNSDQLACVSDQVLNAYFKLYREHLNSTENQPSITKEVAA